MGEKITEERIREMILADRGRGHGADYKSWLRLGRGQFIPKSKHGWYKNPVTGAQQDILSDNENNAGIVGKFLGALDDRPQFPCFTFAHAHPLEDCPGRDDYPIPWSKGTLALAAEACLSHAKYVGTNIYYVHTLDVLFTLPPMHHPGLAALAAKYENVTRASEPDPGDVEKLELQRRYAEEIDAHFCIWDNLVCPSELITNLRSVYSSASLPKQLACTAHFPKFIDFTLRRLETHSIRDIKKTFAKRSGLTVPDTAFLWDHAAWTQQVKVDLTKPVFGSRPAPQWDGEWMKDMRNAMFGCREFPSCR